MSAARRLPANLATLANGLVGLGAVAYVLAGNKAWAMLLIVAGVGFDGLDGFLARRAHLPPSAFGRIADSVADAVTFGLAPAALLWVHRDQPDLWAPYAPWTLVAGLLVAGLAIARLVYFTVRGYRRPDFLGAPTPTNALALVTLVLLLDVPGFLGPNPGVAVAIAVGLAVVMVLPIPFPKLRRGSPIRGPMVLTAIALIVAILPVQFHPASDSYLYGLAEAATVVAAVGMAIYYLVGPFTVARSDPARG